MIVQKGLVSILSTCRTSSTEGVAVSQGSFPRWGKAAIYKFQYYRKEILASYLRKCTRAPFVWVNNSSDDNLFTYCNRCCAVNLWSVNFGLTRGMRRWNRRKQPQGAPVFTTRLAPPVPQISPPPPTLLFLF